MPGKKADFVSVGDNEKFVILVQLAREKGETGDSIRRILRLEGPERKVLINELVARMNQQGERKELIDAVGYLFNDEINEQVCRTIV